MCLIKSPDYSIRYPARASFQRRVAHTTFIPHALFCGHRPVVLDRWSSTCGHRSSARCCSYHIHPACPFPWSSTRGYRPVVIDHPRFSASGQCGNDHSSPGQRKETDTCGASSRRAAAFKHQGGGCTLGSFLRPFIAPPRHGRDRQGRWGGSEAGRVSKGCYEYIFINTMYEYRPAVIFWRYVLITGIFATVVSSLCSLVYVESLENGKCAPRSAVVKTRS